MERLVSPSARPSLPPSLSERSEGGAFWGVMYSSSFATGATNFSASMRGVRHSACPRSSQGGARRDKVISDIVVVVTTWKKQGRTKNTYSPPRRSPQLQLQAYSAKGSPMESDGNDCSAKDPAVLRRLGWTHGH